MTLLTCFLCPSIYLCSWTRELRFQHRGNNTLSLCLFDSFLRFVRWCFLVFYSLIFMLWLVLNCFQSVIAIQFVDLFGFAIDFSCYIPRSGDFILRLWKIVWKLMILWCFSSVIMDLFKTIIRFLMLIYLV